MTEFKALRLASGLTQQAAADLIGAPLRTVQSWEQEQGDSRRSCPPYVLELIRFKLTAQGYINAAPD